MADRAPAPLTGVQIASVCLLLASLALLPFGRAAELAMLVCAIGGCVMAVRRRIDWRSASVRLALLMFAAYWLPELVSAFDAVAGKRAWSEVALDLRYLPFLLFACVALQTAVAQRTALSGCGLILAVWLIDALLQATTGLSIGGPASADRLSGIFGADDLKLGGVVALLSPFLLLPLFSRHRALGALASLAVVIVVLLAGSRAAWVSLALVLTVIVWRSFEGGSKALAALLLSALAGVALVVAGYFASDTFHERIERTSAALQGGDGVNYALSGRVPIWTTALRMFREHPINGVGVRGFRDSYRAYAEADDPWNGFDGDAGAFHAHQIVLEVASETGAFGLLCWVWATLIGLRVWREAELTARAVAAPVSLALLAMLFPLNTHYAFYSSVWGGLLFFLLALWLPMIGSQLSIPTRSMAPINTAEARRADAA